MTIIQVRGLKEVQENLLRIGSVTGTRIMRSSMFTATKPTLDKARATTPVRSGALREAMGRTFSARGSRFSILIGPKIRNRTAIALYNLVYRLRRPRRGIIHGHLQEFGTRTGTRATHWLRRALESTASAAVSLLAATTKKRIESVVKK